MVDPEMPPGAKLLLLALFLALILIPATSPLWMEPVIPPPP